MGLQWTIMAVAVAVAVEAVLSLLLTLPSPKLLKERLNAVISLLLHPTAGVVPFAAFQLIGTRAVRKLLITHFRDLIFPCRQKYKNLSTARANRNQQWYLIRLCNFSN
ncbi:putative B-cell receptor-associated protein [Dioscorea sansibarensis]